MAGYNLQFSDYHYLYLIPKVVQPTVPRFRINAYGCDCFGNLLDVSCLSFNTTDQYFFNKYEGLSRLRRFRTNIPQILLFSSSMHLVLHKLLKRNSSYFYLDSLVLTEIPQKCFTTFISLHKEQEQKDNSYNRNLK